MVKEVSSILEYEIFGFFRARIYTQWVFCLFHLVSGRYFQRIVGIRDAQDVPDDFLELTFVKLVIVDVVGVADPVEQLHGLRDAIAQESWTQVVLLPLECHVVDDLLLHGRALPGAPACLQLHVSTAEDFVDFRW